MKPTYHLSLLTFVVVLFLGSCIEQEQPINDLFKTTEGEYASRMGRFVAAYPSKPFHHIYRKRHEENKDLVTDYHSVLLELDNKRIFNVEYFVLDEAFLADKDLREIKDLMMFDVNNFFQKKGLTVDFFDDKKLQSYEGVFFKYKPNPELRRLIPNVKGEGKAILRDNVIYYVYFLGVFDREAKRFIDSFRFTN